MYTAPHDDVRGRSLSGRPARAAAAARRSRGIATIELAAVLAVTLVMVALAVSVYRTYSARREVSRSLAAVTPIQALVTEAFTRTGVPPASELDVPGLPDATPTHGAIDAVAIHHGRIEIRFGDEAAASLRGRALRVTPFETTEGQIVWVCGDGPADVGLYPLGFRDGTNRSAEPLAPIESRYLPLECR